MKNTELLKEQMSANGIDSNDSSEELLHVEDVIGTPFKAVHDKEHGWFVGMGNYRLTEPVETREEALQPVQEKNWNFLTNVMSVLTDIAVNYKEREKQLNKQSNNN